MTAVDASARHPEILMMTASQRGLEQPNKMRSDTKKKKNPDIEMPDEDSFRKRNPRGLPSVTQEASPQNDASHYP